MMVCDDSASQETSVIVLEGRGSCKVVLHYLCPAMMNKKCYYDIVVIHKREAAAACKETNTIM